MLIGIELAFQEQTAHAHKDVDGRAEFVTDVCEEFRFQARGFDHFVFVAFAFGDIDDGTQDQGFVGNLDRAETYFDGELRTVAAQSEEVASGAHGAGLRLIKKAMAVAGMGGPGTDGNVNLEVLADEIGCANGRRFFRFGDWQE